MRDTFEIPKRYSHPWDGHSNYYTKDCSSCPWYRKIKDSELCGVGTAFKYLVRLEKMRKCAIKNMEQCKEHSVVYLDEIIAALAKQQAAFAERNPALDSFSTN
jgi:hypothetical protein